MLRKNTKTQTLLSQASASSHPTQFACKQAAIPLFQQAIAILRYLFLALSS